MSFVFAQTRFLNSIYPFLKYRYESSKVRELLSRGKYVHEKRTIEVIYLEDDGAIVENLFFWGSPWQPEFCDWAFNLKRGKECQAVCDLIPDQVDVLLTHGPPLGHGDVTSSGLRVGCEDLMYTVKSRLSHLKVHLFGHIHEGYGVTRDANGIVYVSCCRHSAPPV